MAEKEPSLEKPTDIKLGDSSTEQKNEKEGDLKPEETKPPEKKPVKKKKEPPKPIPGNYAIIGVKYILVLSFSFKFPS